MNTYKLITEMNAERDGIKYNNTPELKKLVSQLFQKINFRTPFGINETSEAVESECRKFMKEHNKVIIVDFMKDGTAHLLMRNAE